MSDLYAYAIIGMCLVACVLILVAMSKRGG